MIPNKPTPPWVIVAGLVAIVAVVVGALMYIPADTASEARIGLIITIAGPVILLLTNMLRQEVGVKVSQDTKADTENMLNGGLSVKMDASADRAITQYVAAEDHAAAAAPPPDRTPAGG